MNQAQLESQMPRLTKDQLTAFILESTPSSSPRVLAPPLGLNAKLSRTHLNQVFLAVLLSFWTLCFLAHTIMKEGDLAKRDMLSTCKSLETATNALASTPHFVASALNKHVTSTIQEAERASIQAITFTLTLIKEVLLYIMFRYQKVLQCVITMTLSASLGLIADNAKQITEFVNSELKAISSALSSGLSSLNNDMKKINDATSHLNVNIFGAQISVPSIPLPIKIAGVSDNLVWTLPNNTESSLASLTNAPVSITAIHKAVADLISVPFDDLTARITTDIQSALQKQNLSDPDAFAFLPVPALVDSVHFCSKLPTRSIDVIVEGAVVTLWAGLVLLVLVALGSMALECVVVMVEHAWYEADIVYVQDELLVADRITSMSKAREIGWVLSHPLIRRFVRWGSRGGIREGWGRIAWFMVYCSHPLAWTCLLLGGVGLTVVQLQLVLVPFVAKLLFPVLEREVEASVEAITGAVEGAIESAVGPYLVAMNDELHKIESEINDVLFGSVVETLEKIDSAVLSLFSSFKSDLDTLFSGLKPLENVIDNFFTCVVGNVTYELQEFQSALQNHTGIHLTRVTAEQFGINAAELVGNVNGSVSRSNSLADGAKGLFEEGFDRLLARYAETISFQSVPFIILLCFGGSILVFGAIVVLIDLMKRKKND